MDQQKDRQAASTTGQEPKPAEGISQFIGKVLDQLSLSSWLPAAMLVGCAAVLVQLRDQHNFNVGAAIMALTAKPLGILIVLLFALVLAAMVSQAFSFAAIRILEGYWRGPLAGLGILKLLIRVKVWKHKRLERRMERQRKAAFDIARREMLDSNIPKHIIDIHESEVHGRSVDEWTEREQADAKTLNWDHFCPSEWNERMARTAALMADFPQEHRILPTKLGNILRATEDELVVGEEDLEGFVIRRRAAMSERLQLHHDQYRTRLDMYCVLVFSYLALGAVSAVLFTTAHVSPLGTMVVVGLFLVLSAASYSAAIASARAYCTVLRAVNEV